MTRPVLTSRDMDWDDLPRLAGMGRGDPHPWDYADLARAMESEYAICLTAVGREGDSERVAGCCIYVVSDTTSRSAARKGRLHLTVGLLHLVAEAEAPPRRDGKAVPWRGRGVGRHLVEAVEKMLVKRFSPEKPRGRVRMTATIPESWLGTQKFFHALGFAVPEGGIECEPFDYCPDDGYRFVRTREWPPAPGVVGGKGRPATRTNDKDGMP